MHLHQPIETSAEVLTAPRTVAVTCEGPFALHWGTSHSIQAVAEVIADQHSHQPVLRSDEHARPSGPAALSFHDHATIVTEP